MKGEFSRLFENHTWDTVILTLEECDEDGIATAQTYMEEGEVEELVMCMPYCVPSSAFEEEDEEDEGGGEDVYAGEHVCYEDD